MSRFLLDNETVIDSQTGLMWTINASLLDFPMSWGEALNTVKELNTSGLYGYQNWKIPNCFGWEKLLVRDDKMAERNHALGRT